MTKGNKIVLQAPAKINLSLDVIGKRQDGYHLLEMVMQAIDLYDEITIEKNDSGVITLDSDDVNVKNSCDNLAYRACQSMKKEYHLTAGYHITLKKKIPLAAGLAGGSADCAAVLKGIRTLEKLDVSDEQLMSLSTSLGSDIAFCIMGGTALAEGVGYDLTPLLSTVNYTLVLAKPDIAMSTVSVYRALNWKKIKNHPNTNELIDALKMGELNNVTAAMYNVLEEIVAPQCSDIKKIEDIMLENGAIHAQMSGSGPTVFGIYSNEEQAKNAYNILKKTYQQTYLVKPLATY